MDPNATLRDLREARISGTPEDVAEHAENLIDWLDRGGFLPDAWQPFAATPADSLPAGPTLRDCLTALADAIDNDDDPPAGTSAMLRTFAHTVGNLEQHRDTLRADLADAINDHQSIRADRDELRLALDRARDEANRATRAADDYAQKAHDLEGEARAYRLELQRYADSLEHARLEAENHAAAALEWERIAVHYSSHLHAIHDTLEAARKERI